QRLKTPRFENRSDGRGRGYAMILYRLFSALALALCIVLSSLHGVAEAQSSEETLRDLKSIVAAQVLRVAVTRFHLPSFHVRAPDGTLLGPEIDMTRQIGQALGVKVEFVDNAESFDAVVDLVAGGRGGIGARKMCHNQKRFKRGPS